MTAAQKAPGSIRAAPDVETSAPGAGPERDASSTRERILDIALDLFIEQGFDKTSLRQIAEKLGFSKAALYYHFASKDDILMALHLRLLSRKKGEDHKQGTERQPCQHDPAVGAFVGGVE